MSDKTVPSCIVADNDGHHYIIPAAKRDEWEAFTDIPEDDERGWDVPAFAEPINGSPSLVIFTNWSIR